MTRVWYCISIHYCRLKLVYFHHCSQIYGLLYTFLQVFTSLFLHLSPHLLIFTQSDVTFAFPSLHSLHCDTPHLAALTTEAFCSWSRRLRYGGGIFERGMLESSSGLLSSLRLQKLCTIAPWCSDKMKLYFLCQERTSSTVQSTAHAQTADGPSPMALTIQEKSWNTDRCTGNSVKSLSISGDKYILILFFYSSSPTTKTAVWDNSISLWLSSVPSWVIKQVLKRISILALFLITTWVLNRACKINFHLYFP